MTSRISILEFRNRLKSNTKIGLLHFKRELGMFSIFFPNSKCFYGKFDDTTFRLMLNSNFISPIYILNGEYQNVSGMLKLNYAVIPLSKTYIVVMKYFPLVLLIGFNSFLYFDLKNVPDIAYIIFNSLIALGFFYSRWQLKHEKKKLVQKFNKIFEIDIE